ncbi:MAG: twin-arginine translocase TatA/TatE family subunit [Rhizobiales bacterium]|nr:twin-arginine translocase TatA/TatE family subunit [Hyphomicrobiales bacterium]
MSVGPVQIILILVVIVLLFGRGKISELMGDVAKGIKSFKKGMADDAEEATEEASKTIDHSAEDVAEAAKSKTEAKS